MVRVREGVESHTSSTAPLSSPTEAASGCQQANVASPLFVVFCLIPSSLCVRNSDLSLR